MKSYPSWVGYHKSERWRIETGGYETCLKNQNKPKPMNELFYGLKAEGQVAKSENKEKDLFKVG